MDLSGNATACNTFPIDEIAVCCTDGKHAAVDTDVVVLLFNILQGKNLHVLQLDEFSHGMPANTKRQRKFYVEQLLIVLNNYHVQIVNMTGCIKYNIEHQQRQ